MGKTLVVTTGDYHSNSKLGLTKPVVNLDIGTYRASKNQRIMYNYFLDFCDLIKEKEADRKIAVLNGDIIEMGIKFKDQLISQNKSTIIKNAVATIEPLANVVDYFLVIRGTKVHVESFEELIANDFSEMVIPDKENGSYSHYHCRIDFEGVRFDIAHHASMGRLPWTEKNAANKVASKIIFQYRGQREPHYALRSHNHRWSDSGMNFHPLTAICLPCWQLKTEHVYRIGSENDTPDIGGLFITCEKGESKWERVLYPIDNRKTFMKF